MSALDSFEPEEIVRHLFWTVLFVGSTSYVIMNYVMPNVDDYRAKAYGAKVAKDTLKHTQDVLQDTSSRVEHMKEKISKEASFLYKPPSVNDISSSVSGLFQYVKVTQMGSSVDEGRQLRVVFYTLDGVSSSLKSIMEITSHLKKSGIVSTMELPLDISKMPNKNLKFSVRIAVIQSVLNSLDG